MAKKYNYWNEKSLEEFKQNWQFKTHQEIKLIYPNHTYNQLKAVAGYYHITKKISQERRQLIRLLEWSPESCYWQGFLMGDGSFYKTAIDLLLAVKDINHLKKYISFNNLNIEPLPKNKNNLAYRVQVCDSYTISEIYRIFDFKSPKTYNPYNLNFILNHQYFLPFLIGYIDADGTMRPNKLCVRIIAYKNWEENYKLISNKLLDFNIESKIYKQRNAIVLNIHKKESVINLYNQCKNYNLPLLERKWSKIRNLIK